MYKCLFLLLNSLVIHTFAQNLVPNGSFEHYQSCPGSFSRLKSEFKITGWVSANEGTPDAYNECGQGQAGVPYNWAGVSEAYDGKGYSGIYTWLKSKNFREYIQCKLSSPLTRDSSYTISFRYKLSSYSRFSTNRIGLLLSDSSFIRNDHRAWNVIPTLNICADSAFHPATGTWEYASMQYKAKGNEQFVTIGNFFDDEMTHSYNITHRPEQEEMLNEASYYYIDDVVVQSKYETIEIPGHPEFTVDNVIPDENYILNHIHFEFNKYRLLPRSFDQLDELVFYLKSNLHYRIELSGYTDDVGSESYNQRLSEKRAETVGLYLTQKGIDKKRIVSMGYGKKFPLMPGTSDEIRAMNRRVEVRFLSEKRR